MTELLGLPYSPWSEKARWALDARQVPYVSRVYSPLVGEPMLRVKLRKWRGTVTVPVLTTDGGEVIGDSAEIARWADGRGAGPPALFPDDAAVAHWVEQSERGLAAGRALSLVRMLGDKEALAEMVPKNLRGALGGLAAKLGGFGVARTLRKYRAQDGEAAEGELVAVLDELRRALGSSPSTLLGKFSFADVAMTQVLAFVAPPKFGLRIGAASRRSFTDEAMSARYADLIAWRDAVYEAHRPRPATH